MSYLDDEARIRAVRQELRSAVDLALDAGRRHLGASTQASEWAIIYLALLEERHG